MDHSPDIRTLFAAQAMRTGERRLRFGLSARRQALRDLQRALDGARPALLAALQSDMGRPPTETVLLELIPLFQEISHARRHLRSWMRPRRVWPGLSMLGTSGRVVPQPRGTCLIISPWNYPILLALGPLVSALSAGNSVILKPSELAPATAAALADLLRATFPANLVAVVEGGHEMSQALLALPFDHIFFTGGTAVGKVVMAAAAETLASVTLELGGKSPAIVGPDADLAAAARSLVWGKFANNGQTCVAPDTLYVHQAVMAPFATALIEAVDRLFGSGQAAAGSPDYARIVNDRHFQRVAGLLEDARAKGAKVLAGGQTDPASRFIAPTVLTGLTPDMRITEEEVFGPLLPITPYDEIGPVIAAINAGPRPLALYVYGRDRAFADRIVAETSSGTVGINLSVVQFAHPNLPFGGIGASGQGAAHGRAGFQAISHMRPVLKNRWSLLPLLFPPYRGRVRAMVAALERLVR